MIPKRLKEARLRAKLTQEKLGADESPNDFYQNH